MSVNDSTAGFQAKVLSSCSQSRRQPLRQISSQDFFLSNAEVVGHTIETHDPGIGIEHSKGGAPVAITRLADRAGVDEIAAILTQRPVGRLSLPDGAISGTVGFADFAREHESALQVSVSEEGDRDGIGDERLDSVASTDHVFIFVERGAVNELDTRKFGELDGSLRKRAEPFEILSSELVARPESCQTGDRVEFLKVHETADRFVVIAADEDLPQRLRFGNDFVGIAAIANRIAKIDDEVVGGLHRQTRFQRFEVAVNVA